MLLMLTNFSVYGQGYDIKVKINGLSDTTVILGHYLSKSMYPDDTVRLDKKGSGTLTGKKKLPLGMYLLLLPNSNYFDIIIGEDQLFSLESDTAQFLETLKFSGSEENQIFLDFQKYMSSMRKQADSLTLLIRNEKDSRIKSQLSAELRNLYDTRSLQIEKINQEHPDLYISTFLKATVDIKVPDPPKDEKGNIKDSLWQYYYYRHHFFDNLDISDVRLLRTPFFEDQIIRYISQILPQIPDTLITETDKLIESSRSDSSLFRYMLITLFNHFGKSNIMGMDAVTVHLAEKYYLPESWWSDEKYLTDLKERIEKEKPLLLGKVAPDMELMEVPAEHFKSAAADTSLKRYPHVGAKINMHSLTAKYLVLVFWEADCGHCKVAVPELYKIYKESLQPLGVKVLAISTLFGEDGKIKWIDFVNENGLYDWSNTWNPYSYDFKLKYDILTTPQIYILNEKKEIMAKKIGSEQVLDIIKTLSR